MELKPSERVIISKPGYGYGSGYGYGYGDGYGYGSGYGSGYGYGDGYGSDYGSGDGYGDGSGYGYGDGYGSGYSYGYGYGDGYGYGSGDGDGYGSGDGSGNIEQILSAYISHPNVARAIADGSVVSLAIWRSDINGKSANGGFSKISATAGLLQWVEGPLTLCSGRALHGSMQPHKWKGDRWWVVALFHPIQWDCDKCGSLKRMIIEEIC